MSSERSDRVVQRFALVTLVLPAAVTAVGLLVQLAALPYAPARIPLYWVGSGAPTGWVPAWLSLVLTVVLGFGLPAVFGLSSLPSLRRGDRDPGFRLFGAQALGISVLLTIVVTSLLLRSVESTSSNESRVWLPVFVGLAAGVATAVVGWLLQPRGSRLAQHAASPRSNWRRASVRRGCTRRPYPSLPWR